MSVKTLYRNLMQATSVAHLTNFSFEFFYEIFTEDASQLLYHGAKKSKMTKNSNQGGPALRKWTLLLKQKPARMSVKRTVMFKTNVSELKYWKRKSTVGAYLFMLGSKPYANRQSSIFTKPWFNRGSRSGLSELRMGPVRISSWYPNFNGSHFGLPPWSIHRMTGLGGEMVWTMPYSHRPYSRVK